MPISRFRGLKSVALALALLTGLASLRADEPTLIPAATAGWSQWRGPKRDGVSPETGLLRAWPEKGPRVLWTFDQLGRGYASPIVVKDTLYITGDRSEELEIVALDLNGGLRWKATNGKRWKTPYPGARSACTFDAGRLYHMNANGRLACLQADSGREVWAVNVFERFGAKNIRWGRSEAVVVAGKRVFVTVAGEKALMAALDKETGKTVWASPPLPGEQAAYASPILIRVGPRRLLVGNGSKHAFGVDADTGRLAWSHRHPVGNNVLGSIPFLAKDSVFITNSSREENAFYRLQFTDGGRGVKRVWSSQLKNGQGSIVSAGGRLYAADGMKRPGGIAMIDPDTGKSTPIGGGLAFGAAAVADGRIYYLSQTGEAALLEPTKQGATIVGRFPLVEAKKNDAWTHPVIARGRLFLRYHEKLTCYDVKRK